VNERETASAPGNFFRITFFEPSDFFESVSRDERVFESRVNFFHTRAPDSTHTHVNPDVDGELQHEDRNGQRGTPRENCFCLVVRCFRYISASRLHDARWRI
jgi:hypothetical protein